MRRVVANRSGTGSQNKQRRQFRLKTPTGTISHKLTQSHIQTQYIEKRIAYSSRLRLLAAAVEAAAAAAAWRARQASTLACSLACSASWAM